MIVNVVLVDKEVYAKLWRPWLHKIDAIPSIVHGRLKFEYQEEFHIVISDPNPYALCNATDFVDIIITYPIYEIIPL